jgi:hypothetical protein
MDFVLPSGFLELRTNVEIGNQSPMFAHMSAEIRVCEDTGCTNVNDRTLFRFASTLQGGYNSTSVSPEAHSSNPALDLGPLLHTDQAIDDSELLRRIVWEYDTFEGQLSLGVFDPGETFVVRYILYAEALGEDPLQGASTAINDPFFFTGEPMTGELLRFAAVPEPGIGGLAAMGLLRACCSMRRRR